jgi:hypothetical protein
MNASLNFVGKKAAHTIRLTKLASFSVISITCRAQNEMSCSLEVDIHSHTLIEAVFRTTLSITLY